MIKEISLHGRKLKSIRRGRKTSQSQASNDCFGMRQGEVLGLAPRQMECVIGKARELAHWTNGEQLPRGQAGIIGRSSRVMDTTARDSGWGAVREAFEVFGRTMMTIVTK
jgi:hypothetical protein